MNAKITRRTTVGFGYNSAAENDERGNLRVGETTRPDHVGTILQVEKAIETDRTLESFRSGTYYSTGWFVKIDGQWHKIKNTDENNYALYDLTLENDYDRRDRTGQKYWSDEITVEVE